MNPLSILFDISRQSGEIPSKEFLTVSGRKIRLGPEGLAAIKPEVTLTPNSLGTHVRISARNTREARRILRGLQRKIPGIDVDAALYKAEPSYVPFSDPLKFGIQIDGSTMGRSMVKSAFALAVSSGAKPFQCSHAKRFLTSAAEPCFGYYYRTDLVSHRPENTVLHCVAVRSTAEGFLLGYVELFSTFRIVICLGRDYDGPPLDVAYAIDPIKGIEVPVQVHLEFSEAEIKEIFDYKMIPDGSIAAALDKVMPLAIERSLEKERRVAVSRAVESAWAKLTLEPGAMLTAEHKIQLFRNIAEELTPFFLHLARQGRLSADEQAEAMSLSRGPNDAA